MGMAHMGTDGGMERQGSLWAPLYLVVIDLVGIPYTEMEGCHLSGYAASLRLGFRQGGIHSDVPKAAASVSLGCWVRDCCGRHLPDLLGRGGTTDIRGSGQVMAPYRMLYRSLALIWPL